MTRMVLERKKQSRGRKQPELGRRGSRVPDTPFLFFPSSPFYKIIVPTVDTVRYNYLVSALVSNQNPVLLVGPVGTGKTSIAQGVLQSLPSSQWSVLIVNMSAQVGCKTWGDRLLAPPPIPYPLLNLGTQVPE